MLVLFSLDNDEQASRCSGILAGSGSRYEACHRWYILCSCDGVMTSPSEDKGQESLLSLASNCSKLVVFSGSGLSAGSGEKNLEHERHLVRHALHYPLYICIVVQPHFFTHILQVCPLSVQRVASMSGLKNGSMSPTARGFSPTASMRNGNWRHW